MNKILATVYLIFVCGSLYSQTQQGAWEISLSGNFGSASGSSETTTSSGTIKSESDAEEYLSMAIRAGYYVIDGLVVEPEFYWTAFEGSAPIFSLSANLAYNFHIPESHVTPFILVGYGTGNSIPLFQRLFFRFSNKLDISVLNLGAGVKVFLAEQIALRTEYRYQRFSQERTSGSGLYSSTTKEINNYHNIFFGLSIFFQ